MLSFSTIALIPDCLILSDAHNRKPMIEGIGQSGAEKRIFRRNAHWPSCVGLRDCARAH